MRDKEKAIEIFNKKPKYTNCYVTYNSFLNLIEKELFYVTDENIFILKSENNIFKFLYFTNNYDEIAKAESFLKNINTDVALEYLTKENITIPNFEKYGFGLYKIFSRYSVLKENRISPKRKSDEVQLADIEDIYDVQRIAQSIFDPLCDFIPTIKELEIFVQNKELFIIKKDEIIGFALYLKQPYGYDFRLNCVVPEYQSKLVGYKFVANLPNDGKKYICWADDNNSSAIRLNESIGFKTDGLKNYIFVRNISN